MSIARTLKNRSLEGSLFNNIANVYLSLGELSKAQKFYKESLTIGREIKNYALEATVLNNLSLTYNKLSPMDMLNYQQQCLSVAQKIQQERICRKLVSGAAR